jgi:uncharacterized BrkB/YihY/UPF0761 family membrane protein
MTTLNKTRDAIWLLAFTLSIVAGIASLEEYPIVVPGAIHTLHVLHLRALASVIATAAFFATSVFCAYRILRAGKDRSRIAATFGAALIALAGVLCRFIVSFGYDVLFLHAFRAGFR